MKAKKIFFTCCLSMIYLIGTAQITEYTVVAMGEKIKIDHSTDISDASPNYTESGRTVVNNQGIYFGWFLYPIVTETVWARLSLWQGDQLIQMGEYLEFGVKMGGNNGRRMPLYIGNIPAGKYTLKPLMKQLSKDYWTIPRDNSDYGDDYLDMFSYKNWEYNIEDINTHKAPSVLMLCSENLSDELVEGIGIPTLFNQPEERNRFERFDAFVRFSNKSNRVKKGKIKLMYERDFNKFWLGYAKTVDIMTNWSVSITRGATMNGFTDWEDKGLPIEIPANTKDIRFDIKGCYASDYFGWGTTYTPHAHVYFQPEGSNDWILCGVDAAGDFDASQAVIPSKYQKNCNSFALWISDAEDKSAASDNENLTYDSAAKTLMISNVPNRSYVFIYNVDGKTVKTEPTIADGKYTFSTSGLASGAYLIKIISGTAVRTFKLNI